MNSCTKYNFVNEVEFKSKKEYIDYSTKYRSSIYCNCTFTGFDIDILNGSIFIDCKFYDISIINNIYDTKFENCTFNNIKIDGSHAIDSTILIYADFNHCNFEKININRCYISIDTTIQYCDFKDMIIQNCAIHPYIILACKFYLYSLIAVMNSDINSKITDCEIWAGGSLLYLYKCSFYEGIMYNNKNFSSNASLMIYESNFTDALREICPKEGSFICYKKVYTGFSEHVLATLEIPADAKRIYTISTKCRAEYAKVIKLELLKNNKEYKEIDVACSGYNEDVVYRKGEMVYPDSFDDNMFNDCSNGIHFFMDKNEAINY